MLTQYENARTRVKICGLTTLEDARYASGAMAPEAYLASSRVVRPQILTLVRAFSYCVSITPPPVCVLFRSANSEVRYLDPSQASKLHQ